MSPRDDATRRPPRAPRARRRYLLEALADNADETRQHKSAGLVLTRRRFALITEADRAGISRADVAAALGVTRQAVESFLRRWSSDV